MIQHVLTVCIGNICRSPAAQVLLAHELPGLAVSSAGIEALDTYSADPLMLELLSARGIDASAHRARTIAAWMVSQADLVLVMDQAQKSILERNYPQARGRVFRLGQYLGPQGQDIPDPYRKDRTVFEQVLAQISEGVGQWATRIRTVGYATTSAATPAH